MEKEHCLDNEKAPGNRTLTLSDEDRKVLRPRLLQSTGTTFAVSEIINRTLHADLFDVLEFLPSSFADLLILDPPYNLDKNFNGTKFSKRGDDEYVEYLRCWMPRIVKVLKPNGSVYLCGDWRSTSSLYQVMKECASVRNRITWQREKGRGAKANWKNASEDIWFGTLGDEYYFDVEAVKQKRKVIAPYRQDGQPKDWEETEEGNYRLTHPSNFWDDISIPYWSMPENTDHPAQKPEKLIAKLILASCPPGGVVVDPFLGSGTTSVVAHKLDRNYFGIEMDEEYCLLAEKRLENSARDRTIQGYAGGVFWERNTMNLQRAEMNKTKKAELAGTALQEPDLGS